MKTKQWDKDIDQSIKHRTAAEMLEDYFKQKEEERKNDKKRNI